MRTLTSRSRAALSSGLLLLALVATASTASAGSNNYVIKSWDYPAPGNTNRLFVAAAVGDFNDDAVAEMAVIKRAHSQVLILRSGADSTYETKAALDVDLTNNQFVGMAAGDLNADSRDELIVLRNAPAAGVSNLLVYRFGRDQDWSSSLVAQIRIGAGNSNWKGVASADFDGDGNMDIAVAEEGTTPRIHLFQLSNDTLVLKGTVALSDSATALTAIAAGDLDGASDNRAELVIARQAGGSDKDFLFYKATGTSSWSLQSVGQFNLVGGTTHYPWMGVAIGEFDMNRANGKELVFYKNASQHFHYAKYMGTTTAPVSLGSAVFGSEMGNPWTGVAAGNTILNNGYDELVMVRQKQDGVSLQVVGDEATLFKAKADSLQRGGFHFDSVIQDVAAIRTPQNASPELSSALDVRATKVFLENNHIPAIGIWIADVWNLTPDNAITTPGREYKSMVELLDLLKRTNSPIKVTAQLVTPLEVNGKAYIAPIVGDSPFIGSAELAAELPGVSDERQLFDRGDGNPNKPDAEDYKAWFTLIGILAKKYPNLNAVTIDDFGYEAGADRFFSPRLMGKMVERLRAYSDTVVFLPIMYHKFIADDQLVLRDYTDGFTFYTRNDKHKDSKLLPGDEINPCPCEVYDNGTVEDPVVCQTRCDSRQNMHGAVILTPQAVAGGRGYDIEEIGDFRSWMNNDYKFMLHGTYASKVFRSRTLPTPFTVDAQMQSSRGNANLDGVTMYSMQDAASPMGMAVYSRFATWYLVDDYFNQGTVGAAPAGWTVTTAANTTCKLQSDPSYPADKFIAFTDNSTSGAAAARKSFANQTGTVTAQWQFKQPAFKQQYMYLMQGSSTFAVQILTDGSGRLYYRNASNTDVQLTTFGANVWTAVKVVANVATDTADIYVNGVLRATAAPFAVPVSGLDNIYFTTSGSAGSSTYTHYIDGVSVTQ